MDIPEVVRKKAEVAGAHEWIRHLPTLIADLEDEWACRVIRPLDGATEAYVAQVALGGGELAVLKLLIPRDSIAVANEIEVLRLVDGDGCPRLYRADPSRGAILMELLGDSLESMGLSMAHRHQILCEAARRIWRHVDVDLPTGAEKGEWLIESIVRKWESLDRPLPERVIDHAVDCGRKRIAAHDPTRAVLVHGDVHQWNALATDDGFKLIDPDGLLAEPEYDLGVIMREDPAELMESDPFQRAVRLASLSGLDPNAIWEWGVVERVSTGLILTEIGLQPVGSQMLAAAEYVTLSA
ncbi:MAG TPA: aminoglycoside phosphotransferase family protein [Acidimicrobiia bacterium]